MWSERAFPKSFNKRALLGGQKSPFGGLRTPSWPSDCSFFVAGECLESLSRCLNIWSHIADYSVCSKAWSFTDGIRNFLSWPLFTALFGIFKGVLCPTGCELQTTLVKQEKNVKAVVRDLKDKVSKLSETSTTFYEYVTVLDDKLVKRQKQRQGMLFVCITSVNSVAVLLALLLLLVNWTSKKNLKYSGISSKVGFHDHVLLNHKKKKKILWEKQRNGSHTKARFIWGPSM